MEGNREEPGVLQKAGRLMEAVGDFIEADKKKIGGMTFSAMARLGLEELRAAVSLESNIVQPTPYGMWGTLTPGEVAAEREVSPLAPAMDEERGISPILSPGDIAEDRGLYGRNDATAIYGSQTQTMEVKQTPADIAEDHTLAPEHDHSQGLARKR